MRSPENGAARRHPWDSGLVSVWPVSTTRRPEPKLTSPMALGRPGSTGWRSTASKPDSRITDARNAASPPSSPRTLGMRQICRTRSTARSRSTMSTVIRSPQNIRYEILYARGSPAVNLRARAVQQIGPLVERVGHVPERALEPRAHGEDLRQPLPECRAEARLPGRVEALAHGPDQVRHIIGQVEADPVRVHGVIRDLARQA